MQNSDDNNKKKGPHLSWSTYGKGIHHFKWWILGGTLLSSIAGFLFSKFVYNPKKETITTTLTQSLALDDSKSAYPDGSVYKHTDIISKDNIEAVLEANPEFKYTYESLMEKNAFTVTPITTTVTVDEVSTEVASKDAYTMTTKPGVFRNEKEARKFIRLLVNYEISKAEKAVSSFSYATCLPSKENFSLLTFDKMVDSLNNQFSYLEADYSDLISTFGTNLIVDGSSLANHHVDLTYKYTSYQFKILSGQLATNKYVNITDKTDAQQKIFEYEDLKASYEKRFAVIASTLNTDISLFEKIIGISSGKDSIDASYSKQILELSEEIKSLQTEQASMISELTQIGYQCTKDDDNNVTITKSSDGNSYLQKLNDYINAPEEETEWSKGCATFRNSLTAFYTNLVADTEKASEIFRSIYSTKGRNTIDVKESNMGTLTGHISNLLSAAVCLILGFLLFSLAFALVEMNLDYNRKTVKASSTISCDDTKKPKEIEASEENR